MLIILTGPAGGATRHVTTELARKLGPSYWLGYDHGPDAPIASIYEESPSYECLAALSGRIAFPSLASSGLRLLDLKAIGTSRPKERAPGKDDYADSPDLKEFARAVYQAESTARVIVIHSISRLFEKMQADIISSKLSDWGEKGIEAARTLASNAIAQITWNLTQNPNMLSILTCWDVETTVKGKVTGIAPMIPRASLQQADLVYRVGQVNAENRVTLDLVSGGPATSDTIDPATYDWPLVFNLIS